MIETPSSPSSAYISSQTQTAFVTKDNTTSRIAFCPANCSEWAYGLNPMLQNCMPAKMPYILAIGGGKGGVGKSMLAANLAIHLAQNGLRCLALDLDLGSSNLHTYFGISKPSTSLSDAFHDPEISFEKLLVRTDIVNLSLINAGDLPSIRQMEDPLYKERFQWFFRHLFETGETRGIDLIIYDLGAGNHNLTMDCFAMAHLGLVVTHSEATSLENAYGFLKAHLWQVYENCVKGSDYAADLAKFRYLFQKFKPQQSMQQGGGYEELLHKIKQHYPALGQRISDAVLSRKISLVMNQVRTHTDIRIGKAFEEVSRSYFGLPARHWATLNNDDLAWKALRSKTSLAQFAPFSQLSRDIKTLADQIKNALENHSSWIN